MVTQAKTTYHLSPQQPRIYAAVALRTSSIIARYFGTMEIDRHTAVFYGVDAW